MPRIGQNQFTSRLFADYAFADNAYADSFGRLGAGMFARAASTGGSAANLATFKSGIGFAVEGLASPIASSVIGVGPDDAGDGIGVAPGNPTVIVDAAHTIGTIGTIGDQDYYAVTLEAGKTYEIGQFGYSAGPNLIPLQDAYLELYNAAGILQGSADGGASTLANQVNSGFDAVLTVDITVTGTYYINARAFDNNSANGTTGEGVGDYELYVHQVDPNDPNVYHPYYDASSPLYAIDWGTRVNKVNQTAANPDGNEGTRPTGNAQGTPTYGSALNMNQLLLDNHKTAADIAGKNVITIYFAKAGEIITSVEDPTNPGLPPVAIETSDVTDFEHAAVMAALHEFEKVADVVYLEVQDKSQADFEYASYKGTPGPGISLLGSMEPPDEPNEGLALFNSGDSRWNATDLQQGGFSFVTLIHEIGHGHGLAHPHDNGGHSGIMNGVQPEGAGVADYTTGDYDLNQGVFTMMSYEDGWQTSPDNPHNAPTTGGYGYLGSLMAFDIAAIQDKYGVNEDWATGDDTYTIRDVNAPGTYYRSIWDAGGIDQIVYTGSKDANIDLRPATLKYEYGGGGWVSYALGIYGGFTIANGVTIENATSGSGNDTLIGNAVDNRLDGGAGNDILIAGTGNDTLIGGDGNDVLYFGANYTSGDHGSAGDGRDAIVLQGNVTVVLSGDNLSGLESISLQSGATTKFGDTANNFYDFNVTTTDNLVAAGQQMIVNAQSLRVGEDLTFDGSAETDGKFLIFASHGLDTLKGGAGVDVFFFEGSRWGAGDTVDGGGGRDAVVISAGTGLTHIEFAADSFKNIESISVNKALASDQTQKPSYELVLDNGNVTAGGNLILNANSLTDPTQTVSFDGHKVHDGSLTMFGGAGNDVLIGGDGADLLYGGLGKDNLTGGAGADTFQFRDTAQSSVANPDAILDFLSGTDKIDVHLIDADTSAAGDQAFHWIGANAFTGGGAAGELRAFESGGTWFVEGDTDGNGSADFTIAVTSQSGTPLVPGDFIL
ncbi:MAG: serralysin [Sphingomonadales bacterium]|nr:serralysin [Sphingomonadales bacterium]